MNPERWKQIESIFESALGREPHERKAFLDQACAGDSSLRHEVETLLAHRQPTGRFIATLVHDAARLLPQGKPPSEAEARFIPGTVLAGRYRIIGLFGKGGMGEVYRADDLKLAQPVALKFLPENLASDQAMLERFHREVRIARQISHPNICRVYDIGEAGGQHFLSMEYVDGEDFASLLRRIGRLPENKAVEIATQLCAGLAAAHEQGVLHRDLKPANVMIDGRGKARIMDFGLAGLAGEFRGQEVRAGTPAYMAPEQLAGKEVTVRSDIYSLGLVLYEIFTGRKAFEASSLEELMRKHETTTPPGISDFVKEIDPLVERVILRCLERDPRDRPSSVGQVAAALPGGDPLAAALAAGETPSPEMVAAAPKEGALRPAVAAACLAAFFIELALVVLLSGKVMMHNRVPLEKSGEVLADRAAGLVKRFGYTDSPADTAYGVGEDPAYLTHLRESNPSFDDYRRVESGQPLVYYFWYRQSPRPLAPIGAVSVSPSDPPSDFSGMANVTLDMRGRLVTFSAVPRQVDQSTSMARPDWATLFAEAGLEPGNFMPVDSAWLPPTYADLRAAWEGAHPEYPDIPIRVEAAAYRGRPVYFHVIPPWEKPTRQEEVLTRRSRQAAGMILAIAFFSVLIASVLLARRNLRSGRGDRKGGFKISLVVFSSVLSGLLIAADHIPALAGELELLFKASAEALFTAGFFWLLYIALEPYVRRRWPRLIISWSRLLAGDFRDPMVGRDILIGSLLGFGHTLSICSTYIVSNGAGKPVAPVAGADPAALKGIRAMIASMLSASVPQYIVVAMGLLLLLLLLYILLRRRWLAIAALWLMFAAVEVLAFAIPGPLSLWAAPVIISTLGVVAVARFGLLTTISFQFFFDLTFHYPITPDLSAWYGQTTLFVLPILVAVAIYSFYTSLAGQRVFGSGILRD
ncbi:MAG: serine/threonine-protein kinase [Blastocatellia bacterium]